MAAFTTFSREALARYIHMFDRGKLVSFEPAPGGIENSNYFVFLERDGQSSRWVLTILEDISFDETGFFSRILSHLFHYGLPVAAPVSTLDGMTATIFCSKPAFLFPCLPGNHLVSVEPVHCRQIGAFLASSHQALAELSQTRPNPYPVTWMQKTLADQSHRLSPAEQDQLTGLIRLYQELQDSALPRGLIHGDLFLDNALFKDDELSGVIDFYHACHDLLIQDLAVVINDWCLDDSGVVNQVLSQAVLSGYGSVRTLDDAEKAALVPMQRASAARFALTRLLSGDPPLKDPGEMLELAGRLA